MSGYSEILKGIGVCDGIVIAPAYVVRRGMLDIPERTISRAEKDSEQQRLIRAIRKTIEQLEAIRERMAKAAGEKSAEIIDAQILILSDNKIIDPILESIEMELKNAEFLFAKQMNQVIEDFIASHKGNEILAQRAQDLYDLLNRVLSNLMGVRNYVIGNPIEESILVIPHLAPSESVQLLNKNIVGIITERGGETSHIAIITRTLEIPAVLGVEEATKKIEDRSLVIIDGHRGLVIVNPDAETIKEYEEKKQIFYTRRKEILRLTTKPPITVDGHRVTLSANIELPEQVELVKKYGAEGVGLLRTEILFIQQAGFPSEERQAQIYSEIASRLAPQPVIIRTFDIGGDKLLLFGNLNSNELEPNPFLGFRAIRIGIRYPKLLKQQLKAILRASNTGNVKVMFPMISNIEEVQKALEIFEDAKEELRSKGIAFNDEIEIGIMIEVPSAAILARHLAQYVKFFSIGTNDLIQYVLAVDRGNRNVAELYQSFNPAVLKLVKETITAARLSNIWTGICGEMAGDPLATVLLLGLGVDEFSCVPQNIPAVKSIIRSVRYSDAQKLADEAIQCKTHEQVVELLKDAYKNLLPTPILETVGIIN